MANGSTFEWNGDYTLISSIFSNYILKYFCYFWNSFSPVVLKALILISSSNYSPITLLSVILGEKKNISTHCVVGIYLFIFLLDSKHLEG